MRAQRPIQSQIAVSITLGCMRAKISRHYHTYFIFEYCGGTLVAIKQDLLHEGIWIGFGLLRIKIAPGMGPLFHPHLRFAKDVCLVAERGKNGGL